MCTRQQGTKVGAQTLEICDQPRFYREIRLRIFNLPDIRGRMCPANCRLRLRRSATELAYRLRIALPALSRDQV